MKASLASSIVFDETSFCFENGILLSAKPHSEPKSTGLEAKTDVDKTRKNRIDLNNVIATNSINDA